MADSAGNVHAGVCCLTAPGGRYAAAWRGQAVLREASATAHPGSFVPAAPTSAFPAGSRVLRSACRSPACNSPACNSPACNSLYHA
ncbi:protein of unknown function (plasmid) [Cupriavidus neocaledonicus]|uniref:Uncharacterized protein n=1 Tax=Cupriavidus neocaledonicus TaxID=1040979 RepID=A0A375HP46_9BURK|nr:hypothetical protein CBM2605_B130421 [Cupriavidus neocaledonicus]SPD59205.1 protein of unknown function [Cupriavidus neocaledonicus]